MWLRPLIPLRNVIETDLKTVDMLLENKDTSRNSLISIGNQNKKRMIVLGSFENIFYCQMSGFREKKWSWHRKRY